MAGITKDFGKMAVREEDWPLPEGAILVDAWSRECNRPLKFHDLNARIHRAAEEGNRHIVVINVLGQRFICAGMERPDLKVDIYGTPGNDLGVFMDGPTIEVFGNAEDQAGNTLNSGRIIIHGNAWDVTGLAARDGTILVKGSGGYRIGIHMKEYKYHRPVVMYGGSVKEFFGEYMAGGVLVALGMDLQGERCEDLPADRVARGSLGSGIHGGVIYVRGEVPDHHLGVAASKQPFGEVDQAVLQPILEDFCATFGVDIDRVWERPFTKVAPSSSRPYGTYYNPRSV